MGLDLWLGSPLTQLPMSTAAESAEVSMSFGGSLAAKGRFAVSSGTELQPNIHPNEEI